MRWEDERYVRVYTRDTSEWSMLSWQARALFLEVLRKADRSGRVAMGRHGLRGLASLIRYPLDVVEAAVPELVDDGCLALDGHDLVVPNFVEAQEARKSDAQRKREQRERDREDGSRDQVSQNVTGSHAESRAVTAGHTQSRNVTLSLAQPSLAQPSYPPGGTRASAPESPPPEEPPAGELDPASAAVLVALEARPETRGAAKAAMAQRLASHCREHGHAGQHSLAEVLECIEQAATKLADEQAGTGVAASQGTVARLLASFVRAGPKPPVRAAPGLGGLPKRQQGAAYVVPIDGGGTWE